MPKSTGSACATIGHVEISSNAAAGTLLKKRSETLRSKTIISLSLDKIPENMPMAPCRMVTTVSMAATLKAMPATLMNDRMRWRRKLVTISLRKITAAPPYIIQRHSQLPGQVPPPGRSAAFQGKTISASVSVADEAFPAGLPARHEFARKPIALRGRVSANL